MTSPQIAPWQLPGSRLATNARRAKRGFYAPRVVGAPATTRQAEVLNTAVIGQPTAWRGTLQGQDTLSMTPFAHDPITAYNEKPRLVTAPTSVTLGDVGAAKTSRAMTDMLRGCTMQRRRGVIFDKKDQGGEGEFSEMCRWFGAEPLTLRNDPDGIKINLFDPHIAGVRMDQPKQGMNAETSYLLSDGRLALLQNVIELYRGNRKLDEWEEEALRLAMRDAEAALDGRRTLTPADLLPHFGTTKFYPELRDNARDHLHEAGMTLRFALHSLVSEYAHIFDGETSPEVDLNGRLTNWDISQLPETGPAVPVAMSVGYMWLMGRLKREQGIRTLVHWEEAWHAVNGPLASLIKSSIKLSRALGIANNFNLHKGGDIPEDSEGMTIISEAQTVYLYRMIRFKDADWCARTFDLSDDDRDRLMHLPTGTFIAKIADRPPVEVRHIRSDIEVQLTNSDAAML